MTWFVAWFSSMTLMKAVGIIGQTIFGSRFLVQWLVSEKLKRSVIPVAFWYLSITGCLLTLVYAIYIQEPVFVIAQIGGLMIYTRNLYFVYRDKRKEHPLLGPDRA